MARLAEIDIEATMLCRHCVALLFGRVAFCPYCGADSTRTEVDMPTRRAAMPPLAVPGTLASPADETIAAASSAAGAAAGAGPAESHVETSTEVPNEVPTEGPGDLIVIATAGPPAPGPIRLPDPLASVVPGWPRDATTHGATTPTPPDPVLAPEPGRTPARRLPKTLAAAAGVLLLVWGADRVDLFRQLPAAAAPMAKPTSPPSAAKAKAAAPSAAPAPAAAAVATGAVTETVPLPSPGSAGSSMAASAPATPPPSAASSASRAPTTAGPPCDGALAALSLCAAEPPDGGERLAAGTR